MFIHPQHGVHAPVHIVSPSSSSSSSTSTKFNELKLINPASMTGPKFVVVITPTVTPTVTPTIAPVIAVTVAVVTVVAVTVLSPASPRPTSHFTSLLHNLHDLHDMGTPHTPHTLTHPLHEHPRNPCRCIIELAQPQAQAQA
ncbi:hypothetical protein F5879DRAFT_995705 [Lentinula edodes]|nr:hypothetical protein F5879DRAFT_995705 [Lentinula edodes]